MTKRIYKHFNVTYTFDDIKQLLIDNIEEAHNNKVYALHLCKTYSIWHDVLTNFYNIKYNNDKNDKKILPTMNDKLAFVILLSYPKDKIESFNNISDVKLYNHNNSDFIHKSECCFNIEESDYYSYDCICSYKKLQTIYVVENIHSGISLQVGSICITKHNLISNEDIKKFKETEKMLKEQRNEIKEGKLIGYYEEERRKKKEEREINKLKKENEIIEKKIKTGNFKICYNCGINIVGIKNSNICICNKCKNNTYQILCSHVTKYQINECENCNNKFIDLKQNDPYLCKNCKTQYKIIKCCMILCPIQMIVDINENNTYCDDCENKIIKCKDCSKDFIQNNCESRCKHCQYNYDNNLVNKMCITCNTEMIVKKQNYGEYIATNVIKIYKI